MAEQENTIDFLQTKIFDMAEKLKEFDTKLANSVNDKKDDTKIVSDNEKVKRVMKFMKENNML